MKNWIKQLVISLVLLSSLLLVNDYAAANQLSNTNQDVPELKAPPVVEKLPDTEVESQPIKQENTGRFCDIATGTNKLVKLEGLFTLYCLENSGKIFLEIQPKQLNKNYLATITLESGIGESGIYSGLPLADFLFYFRRVNNNLQFVARNVKFRTESGKPEQRAIDRSFSDSVLGSLPIDRIDVNSKNILVSLEGLLMQDLPGLTPILKSSLHADYRLIGSHSYFGDVNSFPENVEIDSVYNFLSWEGANLLSLPDSRALTLKVHYSFSALPENNGYIPRLADDRVGYFITAFRNFSDSNAQEPFVSYINRWHLEPSNPEEPSVPKKPIVFWIENAVPLSYRDAIREGVLMWNKAFAKAGFQNAIEVRQMPDDADWQPADVRYNTIRWFNSLDAGFARGPARVNPLTGEILDADIVVDANMVRSIEQQYSIYAKSRVKESQIQNQEFANSSIIPVTECMNGDLPQTFNSRLLTAKTDNDACYSMEVSEQAAMGAVALSLLQNTTPNSDQMKEYVHQYLRSLIAHEVGHTLGLRHNFHGSTMLAPTELNNTEITHSKGLVGSIMDYVPANIAPVGVKQGDYFPSVVGPYDEWAIEYGYKISPRTSVEVMQPEAEKSFLAQIALASPQPELSYATDEDISDINPLANVWDLSSDVLVYSHWQLDNARMMWLRLNQGDLPQGESYSHLRGLFNRVLQYYFRHAALLSKYIGGQSFERLQAGDETFGAFVPVSRDQQRQALTKLQEYVFAENAFSFSPQLLNQLAPSRWQHWGSPVGNNRLDYPFHDRILRFQSRILRSLLHSQRLNRLQDIEIKTQPGETLTMPELFDTLQQGIWTEIFAPQTPKPISSIRRSLQREHLNILLEMVLGNTNAPADGRTIAWYELRLLQKAIDIRLTQQSGQMDIYTLSHLELSRDRISKALNAQLISQ